MYNDLPRYKSGGDDLANNMNAQRRRGRNVYRFYYLITCWCTLFLLFASLPMIHPGRQPHSWVHRYSYNLSFWLPGCVSNGTSPSVTFGPFRGRANWIVGRLVLFAGRSPKDHSPRCGSAAFFNESINREIITGRYLKIRRQSCESRPNAGPTRRFR